MYDPNSGTEGLFYFDVRATEDGAVPFGADDLAVASTCADLLRDSVLKSATRTARSSDLDHEAFSEVLTQSDRMDEVLSLCAKVAPSPYTVLFTGETGTGKGLLASIIHRLSPRKDEAFVSVNCAAIPETLLEGELFGHVRGAFTGADRDKVGLLVSADHGTLFLDEVGKMSLPMQAKLLHFLDSREVRPVGSAQSRVVDVRVLCASKSNLEAKVEAGDFLEDLYYRLLEFPIEIPPLRDRGEDIVLLAQEFVTRACADLQRPVPTLTRAFVSGLRRYAWPGNVRELEKAMRRAVVLAAGESRLGPVHLPAVRSAGMEQRGEEADHAAIRPLKEQVSDLERAVLQRTLDELGWNRSEAARQLKISYPTLLQKIRLYDLKQGT
jgi:sigma-54-dependent transcriptional regulator